MVYWLEKWQVAALFFLFNGLELLGHPQPNDSYAPKVSADLFLFLQNAHENFILTPIYSPFLPKFSYRCALSTFAKKKIKILNEFMPSLID